MNENAPSLRQIFADLDARLNDRDSRERRSLAEKMKGELKGVQWVASLPDLGEKIAQLLNVDLPGPLLQFWRASDRLRRALQESAAEPKKEITVGLFDHQLKAEFHPQLEVVIMTSGIEAKYPLTFDLLLACKLTGVELNLLAGEIVSIRTGCCEVTGTLEYKKLVLARAPRKGHEKIYLGSSRVPAAPPPSA